MYTMYIYINFKYHIVTVMKTTSSELFVTKPHCPEHFHFQNIPTKTLTAQENLYSYFAVLQL